LLLVLESVKLRVNKVTSDQTLFPLPFDHFPFCQPEGGYRGTTQNLGQHLAGDRILSSPYQIIFGVDMYCEQLCISHVGRTEQTGAVPNKVARAIHDDYHANWLLDDLPAASKDENENYITTRFHGGFPMGFVQESDAKAYVYNHVNLEIMYHPVHGTDDKFRIVRFTVQPFSIKHDFRKVNPDSATEGMPDDASILPKPAALVRPTASCDPKNGNQLHTGWETLYSKEHRPFQAASGQIVFTYDVIWIENLDLHYSDRWDIYLSGGEYVPTEHTYLDACHRSLTHPLSLLARAYSIIRAESHWLSTIISLVLLLILSSMIVTILASNLRRDFSRYNRVATDEEKEEALEEYGWKLVHADVFRPPSQPLWLAVAAGTGAQLLVTSMVVLILAMIGVLRPMNRGQMVMAELVFFCFFGLINGGVTGYLYKTLDGQLWKAAAAAAAWGYSGFAFFVFFAASCMANQLGSTMAVPFSALLAILVLWLVIAAPLTFLGAYIGFSRPAVEFPTNTSKNPRPIPAAPWYTSTPLTVALAGLFPFVPCFFEIFETLETVWADTFDPFYGFFFFLCMVAVTLAAEITLLLTYFQLVREDYRWWWNSFATAGAVTFYIAGYSAYYYHHHLGAQGLPSWFLYTGYTTVACLGLFCLLGFIGLMSALTFCRAMFGGVKID
jgi:transmembrane 9 superfamily protein 2/4